MSPADMVWLVAMVGTEIAGFMRADRVNNSTYSVHVMFFKKFRGAVAREAGKLAKDFMRQMCNCTCLVAIMPCNLPYVKQFCDDNEFKIVGQLTQSYKKNGRYYDQFIMEAH
jgi:RimJ/RimL family protein N-acetyltransferase